MVSAAEAPMIAGISGSVSMSWLCANDLSFIQEVLREQWANWAVNQSGNQSVAIAGFCLALNEPTRNLTCGIGFFLIMDREWKE